MRGSDPDAAVYYLAAMLEGGEDPRFIARRMVVLASEDIGNADPQALLVAVAAAHAVEHVGPPGGAAQPLPGRDLPRARAEVERELSWRSSEATQDVREGGNVRPPKELRDAHYPGAKKLGHGAGYIYPHDDPAGFDVDYLPDELKSDTGVSPRYYRPRDPFEGLDLAAVADFLEGEGENAAAAKLRRCGARHSTTRVASPRPPSTESGG